MQLLLGKRHVLPYYLPYIYNYKLMNSPIFERHKQTRPKAFKLASYSQTFSLMPFWH